MSTVSKAVARVVVLLLALVFATPLMAQQQSRIGDLASADVDVPVRVVGYGLVVGLDGTGDRAIGGFGARHTVQSVVNLLRNFGVEVPAHVLRTRNVAAVLVTAEASAFLRPGGRFDVQVASVGDAVSLRGGVLWSTPLVYDAGGPPVATAQGSVLMSEGQTGPARYTVETSARIPAGGLLLADLPPASFASTQTLILRDPNLDTATRIADAINTAIGDNSASVVDPGAVALTLPADPAANPATVLAQIVNLTVETHVTSQVLVDAKDGTVVAGGNITVGPAIVSHGGLTLTIGSTATDAPTPGEVRVATGARIQDIAAALHGVGAPAPVIAAIFESLRRVGSIAAEVHIR